MKISDHLELIKTQIQALPSSPTVKFFSGELTVDDLNDLKLDGKRPYILLSCGGGNVPEKNQRVKLELDSLFGAWIIGKVDPSSHGMSSIAADTAVEIAQLIENYRGDPKTNTRAPVVQLIKEAFNGVTKGKSSYSAWTVIWSQRIVLV
ncbi:hypothetical protein [Pseudomonas sp. PNPG3]|uniref:hypothetical protein n=1 Tax=Pseudomonas sp. PNPG3 TaxID=2919497 RepID=UPI001FFD233B|nr:hypothetical protein [Pseudomonas sp. PNPG3]MCK2124888.1 hypothetical protein [Pseudomonas sp. PNPG3]